MKEKSLAKKDSKNSISAKMKIQIILESINGSDKKSLAKKHKLDETVITGIIYSKHAKMIKQEYLKSLNDEVLIKVTNEMNAIPILLNKYFTRLTSNKAIKKLSDDEIMRNIGFVLAKYKDFSEILEKNTNILIQQNTINNNTVNGQITNTTVSDNILSRFVNMINEHKTDVIMLNNPNYNDDNYNMIEPEQQNE